MSDKRILVWDLPTRLFHWLLVVALLAAVITGQLGGGLIEWHGRIGLLIVGLLAFRLVWGVAGSTYARFAHFFPTPARVKAYLGGQLRGDSTYSARRWFWLDLGLSIGFGAIFLAIIGLTEIPWLIAGVVLFLVSVTLICKSFAQRC